MHVKSNSEFLQDLVHACACAISSVLLRDKKFCNPQIVIFAASA